MEKQSENLALRINGKADASTTRFDMATQLLLEHLRLLTHPDPRDALDIGLGAGNTADPAARHAVDRIKATYAANSRVRSDLARNGVRSWSGQAWRISDKSRRAAAPAQSRSDASPPRLNGARVKLTRVERSAIHPSRG